MASTRQQRVQELLVHEISDIVRRELSDPRIGFVTITDAEISPDLRHARVFFSVLGSEQQRQDTGTALNRAAGFIRSHFSRRAQMRFTPEIRFVYDTAGERGLRISQLLDQVKQEDQGHADAPDAPDAPTRGTAEGGGEPDPEGE